MKIRNFLIALMMMLVASPMAAQINDHVVEIPDSSNHVIQEEQ